MSAPTAGLLSEAELQAAYAWFAARPAIREVILTGGDPLMLSPRRLGAIVAALSAIPHIESLRVHTRVPVADPALVTDALAAAMEADKPLWLVVHANHAREFTPDARAALRRILARGIPLLGQSVLLRGVNDSADALEALFRAMLAARVKPYYLHQLDPAPGTARFHVPIEEGQRPVGAPCAGGSPAWRGRPTCWTSPAATGKCRSVRTTWTRTGVSAIRGVRGTTCCNQPLRGRREITASTSHAAKPCVMAGLGPATHDFAAGSKRRRGWPGQVRPWHREL